MIVEIFKLLVLSQWVLLIILVLFVWQYAMRTTKIERFILSLLIGYPEPSINDIREKVLEVEMKLKTAKANMLISSAIVILSLLFLWYVTKAKYIDIRLPSEFFILSILGIIPIPVVFVLFENYSKKILKKYGNK